MSARSRAWLGVGSVLLRLVTTRATRAFTDFDGLHLRGFPAGGLKFHFKSLVSTYSTTRAQRTWRRWAGKLRRYIKPGLRLPDHTLLTPLYGRAPAPCRSPSLAVVEIQMHLLSIKSEFQFAIQDSQKEPQIKCVKANITSNAVEKRTLKSPF